MINKLVKKFHNINKFVFKIMKEGIYFSSCACLLGILILITYIFTNGNIHIYNLGINLLKIGAILLIEFIALGLAFDKIYKDLGF